MHHKTLSLSLSLSPNSTISALALIIIYVSFWFAGERGSTSWSWVMGLWVIIIAANKGSRGSSHPTIATKLD